MKRITRVVALALLLPLAAYAGLISVSGGRGVPSPGGGGGGSGGTSSSLAALAAGTAGTWVRWPEGDISIAHVNPPSGAQDPVTSNGLRGVHDLAHHKIYYYGHGHTGRLSRMLTFDEATDTWTSNNTDVPLPEGGTDAHQFTGFTGNPANGYQWFFAGDGGGNGSYKQVAGASSWTTLTTIPGGGHAGLPGASFNPNLGSAGRIIVGDLYGVYVYDVSGDTWSTDWRWSGEGGGTDPQGDPPLGDETISFWDPRTDAVYVGGGNNSHMVKIPTSGTHSVVGDIPGSPPPYFGESSQLGPFMVDGYVSTYSNTNGHYRRPKMVLPGSTMRTYDGSADTWSSTFGSVPSWGTGNHTGFYVVMEDYDGIVFENESSSDGSLEAYFYPNLRADEL